MVRSAEVLGFIREVHAGQEDAGGRPAVHHPLRVAYRAQVFLSARPALSVGPHAVDVCDAVVLAWLHHVVTDCSWTVADVADSLALRPEVLDTLAVLSHAASSHAAPFHPAPSHPAPSHPDGADVAAEADHGASAGPRGGVASSTGGALAGVLAAGPLATVVHLCDVTDHLNRTRLARLPAPVQMRLRARYEPVRAALRAALATPEDGDAVV